MTSSDPVFHFPPDVFDAVVDAVPVITRGKKDVLLFFQGCGVNRLYLRSLEPWTTQDSGKSKYHITRAVLAHLNEIGDSGLRQRREVLRRVAEFDNFSSCYPDNELKAKGAVATVAQLVNRKDSFTRMQNEYEAQARKDREKSRLLAAEHARKREARDEIRRDLYGLFGSNRPSERGRQFEQILNRLFVVHDIQVRESFVVTGESGEGVVEQIDGAVEIDKHLYLVELKWWKDKLGRAEVAPHLVSVYGRADAGGIMVSASGFHESAISEYRSALGHKKVILVELREIVAALEADHSLLDLFRPKLVEATLSKQPLTYPLGDLNL